MLSHLAFVAPFFILLSTRMSLAVLVNRTIDDEFGDSVTGEKLTYFPSDATSWKQGQNCTSCAVSLDPSHFSRGTWHEGTQHTDDPVVRSITARFSGTAVYVYSAVSVYLYSEFRNRTVTYLEFDIDGNTVGKFSRDKIETTEYGVLVYAQEGLADGPHILVIRVPPGPKGRDWSFVLFDYIQYTTSNDTAPLETHTTLRSNATILTIPTIMPPVPPTSSEATRSLSGSGSRAGVITAASVGAAVMLAMGGMFVLWRRKMAAMRIRRRPTPPPTEPTEDTASTTLADWRSSQEGTARVRALEEELARMRALMERPPGYETN